MPVVIEEMTGEILPPQRPEDESREPEGRALPEAELRRRVRQVLDRERRHADRLSDR